MTLTPVRPIPEPRVIKIFMAVIYDCKRNFQAKGRESTVNRALDGSIYPGQKLAPFSLKIILLRVKKDNKLYSRLVMPSSG